jgi:hypothetical protein
MGTDLLKATIPKIENKISAGILHNIPKVQNTKNPVRDPSLASAKYLYPYLPILTSATLKVPGIILRPKPNQTGTHNIKAKKKLNVH